MSVCPAIVIHAGAGNYGFLYEKPASYRQKEDDAIIEMVLEGWKVLANGGTALDAVEAATVALENHPRFNAGIGSYYTQTGELEMDAAIMDGTNLKCGAVACVKNFPNPVTLARLIMDKSDHCVMVGQGATQFAVSQGIELVPDDYHRTDKSQKKLDKYMATHNIQPAQQPNPSNTAHTIDKSHDTVGAVACDAQGNVAFATSTGGITGKLPGRCGDCPLIGAGGYADNQSGAVTVTGRGEDFIQTCLSRHGCYLMEQGMTPQEACDASLKYMKERVGGTGGVIALDTQGRVGVAITMMGMNWAYVKGDENKIHHGIFQGENLIKDL